MRSCQASWDAARQSCGLCRCAELAATPLGSGTGDHVPVVSFLKLAIDKPGFSARLGFVEMVSSQRVVPSLSFSIFTVMLVVPSTFEIKGEVDKLRLIRGTTPPPCELRIDDPYVVQEAESFNVTGVRNTELHPEIGRRDMNPVPGTSHAHGWFECGFFQQEDRNAITNQLHSLRFDRESERFYAEVHYVDGRYLTVPIMITSRCPQDESSVRFLFFCTDLPNERPSSGQV